MENNATKNESNFFAEFTKIILGLLIGLASFQVLVPLIWNYLSELLHLERLTSFRWIIFIYFLLPALIIVLWWFGAARNQVVKLITNCFSKKETTHYGRLLYQLLSVFFPAVLLIYFLLLLFPYIFDIKVLFYMTQVVTTFMSGLVLWMCCRLTMDRLDQTRVRVEVKKGQSQYRLLAFVFILLFTLFAGFEFLYLSHIDKTKAVDRVTFDALKIENKEVIKNAFRLNDLRDNLAQTRKKFEENQERLIQSYKLELLKEMVHTAADIKPQVNKITSLVERSEVYDKLLATSRNENRDSTLGIQYLYMEKQIGAMLKFVDLVADCTAISSGNFSLRPPPYKIDSILSFRPYEGEKKSSIELMKKEMSWYEMAIPVLKIIEIKLNNLSKRQLTLTLSNVQMKGIFLFSTLIILIGSLFLFVKVNKELIAKESENTESSSILRETNVINEKLLKTTWIFLNVGAWLLIPLFKPVKESLVNVDQPLQTLTFARDYASDVRDNNYDQSENVYNNNAISISIAKGDTVYYYPAENRIEPGTQDTSMNSKIIEILGRVRKINNEDDEASILRKYYEIDKGTKPVKVDNNTFRNPNKK